MSRLIHLFSLMYPRAWRMRYGVEYAALLEDVRPDARTAVDVLSGALTMQMRTWKSWKVVAVSAVFGAAVIAGLFMEMPTRYISSAIIKVEGQGSPLQEDTLDRINSMQQNIESRGKLTQIITTYDLYRHERSSVPLDDVIEEMRKHIVVEPLGGPNVPAFRVQFSYNDPQQAQKVTQDLVARFLDENYRQSAVSQPADAGSGTNFQVLDPAELPMNPAYPNKPLIVGFGIASFLVMWGGLSAWRSVSARRYAAAGGVMSSDLPGGSAPAMTMPPLGLHLRRKSWKIILAVVLLGAVAVFAYKLANPVYESKAVIRVKAANAQDAGKNLGTLISSVESRSSLVRIMDDENLYIGKRTQVPLDDVLEEMKRNIRIEPLGKGVAARIAFTYRDRHVAQRVTEALVLRFVAESSAGGSAAAISIIDPANLPESRADRLPPVPVEDDLSFGVGIFFGAILGVIFAMIVRLFRRSPVPA